MKFGTVQASALLGDSWSAQHHLATWQDRHGIAMATPSKLEAPLVMQLAVLAELVQRYGQDPLMREEVVAILLATQQLLNGEWGNIDRGTIDGVLQKMAESMGFDMAVEKFVD